MNEENEHYFFLGYINTLMLSFFRVRKVLSTEGSGWTEETLKPTDSSPHHGTGGGGGERGRRWASRQGHTGPSCVIYIGIISNPAR